jgi:signal transduction histidine kinase
MRAKEISELEMQLTINIVVDSAESNTRNKQYLKLFSKQSKTLGNGRITITDNGCGIEPSQLQRVLEPFVSSADGLGHGLGLPFCKRVLDNSGGQLTIQSQLNIGTSITLTLPIYQPEN